MIDIIFIEHGIVKVTLNNPKHHNALNYRMMHDLADLWESLESNDSVRAVVITGEGSSFCTGADLSDNLHKLNGIDDLIDRALLKTRFFAKPLIAAINGHCVAGGLELALAADIRIASKATRIGFPEVNRGIVPSGGGAMKLIEQIPYAQAMDLLITGRLISGEESESIGLVTESCESKDVLPIAINRAQMISRNSPLAIKLTKRAALEYRSSLYKDREPAERNLVELSRQSGHPDEGISAFLEKREPSYSSFAE